MKIKKIGILTSGGDAPGMNAAVRSLTRAAIENGIKVAHVYNGYQGLVNGDIVEADRKSVANILNRGGTFIRTSRLPSFTEKSVRADGIKNMKKHKIDLLVVIGGDGSYKGAQSLAHDGFPTVGLPGTIDNDVASTEYTIGFDTALNTVVDLVDKLRDTSLSHNRCSVIEVMGRHCGDLALNAAIACGAEVVSAPERIVSDKEIAKRILECKRKNKQHAIVIVAENTTDINKLSEEIEKVSGFNTRPSILGYVQRGGTPSAFDRVLASRMGIFAVEEIVKGNRNFVVGVKSGRLAAIEIDKATKMKRINNAKLGDEAEVIT